MRIRQWLSFWVVLGLGWAVFSCSDDDSLATSDDCVVAPLDDGGVQVTCPGTEPVTIDSGDACIGASGFSIQGIDGIGDEVVVSEANEFVVLTDSTRPVELTFAGVGSFTVVDAEAHRVRAVFESEGVHTFAVIATDGCSIEVFTVQVNAVACHQVDCDGVCLSASYFDQLYQNTECDGRLNCSELNFDGGDCSCVSQGLQADCWGRCVGEAELAAVGNGSCDSHFGWLYRT